MKKILQIFLTIHLAVSCVSAQTPDRRFFDVKKMMPTSPDAAMLGRFGDVPVGYYTGTADISIPLYTIKEAGLEIPIVLRYHSSGIKVQDEASWVGLGWSLEPSGSIIQVVNGRNDELDNITLNPAMGYDFLKENMLLGAYSSKYTDEESNALFNVMNYGDGQPDYYFCNFPGFSCKFYINPENKEVIIIDKKVGVNIENNGSLGWTVTMLNGNKFLFTIRETASSYAPNEIIGSTYKLSKIKLISGKEINFEYSDGNYDSYNYSQTWHTPFPYFEDLTSAQNFVNTTLHQVKYIKSINAQNLKIDFELEDRADLMFGNDNDGIIGNGILSTKRLKSIVLKDATTLMPIKAFNFGYDYFAYNLQGGSFVNNSNDYDKLGKRLKLNSVQEIGYNSQNVQVALDPYNFFMKKV